MARKRTRRPAASKPRRRRARVGAVGAVHRRRRTRRRSSTMSGVPDFLMLVATAAAGNIVGTMASKFIPVQNPMIKAGIKVAAAFALVKFIKHDLAKGVAIGVGLSGINDLGKQFLPQFFAGIGDGDPVVLIQGVDDDSMSGSDQLGDSDGGANSLM